MVHFHRDKPILLDNENKGYVFVTLLLKIDFHRKSNCQRWRTCFVNKESRWRQTLSDMAQAVRLQPVIESERDKGLTVASEFIFHLRLTGYYYF